MFKVLVPSLEREFTATRVQKFSAEKIVNLQEEWETIVNKRLVIKKLVKLKEWIFSLASFQSKLNRQFFYQKDEFKYYILK